MPAGMKAVFPGKPQATLHALSTTSWQGNRIISYISGNSLIILNGPNHLLQTIPHNEDEELVAVAVDEITGKIATCTNTTVYIYKTANLLGEELRWSLQHVLIPKSGDDLIATLSWGQPDEILVGGSSLTLISTDAAHQELWSKSLANPVKFAAFYSDATLIASTGWHDKLVKIWTRIYYGQDSQRFDVTYLPHPATVTDLRWRRGPPEDEHAEPVLYTTCTDNKLRVWAATDSHALQTLQLWTELNLDHCVQPRIPNSPSTPGKRFSFIIDKWTFKNLVEKCKSSADRNGQRKHTHEYLGEVATRDPEVCVVFDDHGNMSAWGLERVGCKARQPDDVFNIAHPEGLELYQRESLSQDCFLEFVNFSDPSEDVSVNLLSHAFSSGVEWLSFDVDKLLDPSNSMRQYLVQALWTGHSRPVERLEAADKNRDYLLTSYAPRETLIWTSNSQLLGLSLQESGPIEISNMTTKLVNGDHSKHLQNDQSGTKDQSSRDIIVDPDGTAFVIRNPLNGCLEHMEEFEQHETIVTYRWTYQKEGYPILAVGLLHKVFIYTPLQLNYVDLNPSWARIRTIDLWEVTNLPVVDFAWLKTGDLVVAAGSQLFLYGHDVETPDSIAHALEIPNTTSSLFQVVSALNASLAVFNPHFLAYCIFLKDIRLVHNLLKNLREKLKYYTEGDELSTLLDISISDFISDQPPDDDDEEALLNEDSALSLKEKISSLKLPWLRKGENSYLMDLIQQVATTEKHLNAVDGCGILYLTALYRQYMPKVQNEIPPSLMSWREINWAFQSTSQEILVDLTARRYNGRILWKDARECGMFTWLLDSETLKTQFEAVARNEYTKTEEKNPIDCTLYYLALRKKSVLQGLWRLATWNREQAATLRLLANNFDDPRWKTAAQKNAYALLGLRRFEYAAAFFLLADSLKDAIAVILNQVKDVQLAIAVARVYEGDKGPNFRRLLEDKLLPQAASEGNRWLAAWTFCMLDRRDMALKALVRPLDSLIETSERPDPFSKHFTNFDPAMVVLYKLLRKGDPQKPNKEIAVDPKDEWNFVLRNARILRQMGCDILALDLVRNWEFSKPLTKAPPGQHKEEQVDEEQVDEEDSDEEGEEEQEAKPALTNGLAVRTAPPQEPSADSILDSFGF